MNRFAEEEFLRGGVSGGSNLDDDEYDNDYYYATPSYSSQYSEQERSSSHVDEFLGNNIQPSTQHEMMDPTLWAVNIQHTCIHIPHLPS